MQRAINSSASQCLSGEQVRSCLVHHQVHFRTIVVGFWWKGGGWGGGGGCTVGPAGSLTTAEDVNEVACQQLEQEVPPRGGVTQPDNPTLGPGHSLICKKGHSVVARGRVGVGVTNRVHL